MKRRGRWVWLYALFILGLTTYLALDTFVLKKTYGKTAGMNLALFETEEKEQEKTAAKQTEEAAETKENSAQEKAGTEAEEGFLSDNQTDSSPAGKVTNGTLSYEDEHMTVYLAEYEVNDTAVHVAEVWVSSAQYLKTAFANDTYGRNITATTSDTAERVGAVLAINGDYYGAQEKGYVIRNGVLYRSTRGENEVLCIYADGSFAIVDPKQVTAQELVDQGVWQAFSFGPGLIKDGQIAVGENDEVGRAKASNPRTAVAVLENNHYLFVVSDGRTSTDKGLSLYELAEFLQQFGVTDAYNLDGGGSSSMVLLGEVVNTPVSGGRSSSGERKVSDIVYIG